jgi:alkylhydroperoxidase family enzyme
MPTEAWIEIIEEDRADKELASAYAGCADPATGRPANIMRVHGLNPKSMLAHRDLYQTLMFGPSPLGRSQREMIGTVVSTLNRCHY